MTSTALPFPTRDDTMSDIAADYDTLDAKYMALRLAGYDRPEIYAHLGISDAPAPFTQAAE